MYQIQRFANLGSFDISLCTWPMTMPVQRPSTMFTLFTVVTAVTRVHIVHRGQLGSGPHSPETSSPWYKDLQAVAAVFSRLQHHRSPECVHQLLN